MDAVKTTRNVAIIVAIAAALYFLPGGGGATRAFEAALYVGFGVAIGYIGVRVYRERRVAIHGLGDRHRALLYGGLALGVFVWAARSRMWQTGLGEAAWFVLVAIAAYSLMEVFRRSRSY